MGSRVDIHAKHRKENDYEEVDGYARGGRDGGLCAGESGE